MLNLTEMDHDEVAFYRAVLTGMDHNEVAFYRAVLTSILCWLTQTHLVKHAMFSLVYMHMCTLLSDLGIQSDRLTHKLLENV